MLRNRPLLFFGCALVLVSIMLYFALNVSTAHEQALSPGEKSLGVAVLGIMFGIPMMVTGVAGVLLLTFSALRAVYRRLFSN
jgi:hypothetical protein